MKVHRRAMKIPENGLYYTVPAPDKPLPPSDTVKFLKNVATKKYSYEMVSNSYYDGRNDCNFPH